MSSVCIMAGFHWSLNFCSTRKVLELHSRKAGKTIQGTFATNRISDFGKTFNTIFMTCYCFVLYVWKPSVVKISITKTNVQKIILRKNIKELIIQAI